MIESYPKIALSGVGPECVNRELKDWLDSTIRRGMTCNAVVRLNVIPLDNDKLVIECSFFRDGKCLTDTLTFDVEKSE